MDTFNPYDLLSAFESATRAARDSGQVRYVIQTAIGYHVCKTLEPYQYNAWKVNADGSIADDVNDPGYVPALVNPL